jgi:hypothetical protein
VKVWNKLKLFYQNNQHNYLQNLQVTLLSLNLVISTATLLPINVNTMSKCVQATKLST